MLRICKKQILLKWILLGLLTPSLSACLSGSAETKEELANAKSKESVAESTTSTIAKSELISIDEINGIVLQEGIFRDSQKRIAACMKTAGFSYIPRQWKAGYFSPALPELGMAVDELRSNGYGDLVAYATGTVEASRTDPNADANDAILNNLSQEERTQYTQAMHGPDGSPQKGCNDSSVRNAYESVRVGSFEIISSLSLIGARVTQSEKYRTAESGWRSCMARQGWKGPAHPGDMPQIILKRVSEEQKQAGAGNELSSKVVTMLRDLERSAASDDADCREANLNKVVSELQTEERNKVLGNVS
jgi:ribosomal protein S20